MYMKIVLLFFIFARSTGLSPVLEVKGDVYIAVLLKNCPNITEPTPVPLELQSLASSALWTTQRINFLEMLSPLKFGISIHEVCNGTDHFKTIFELYQKEEYLMGLITDERLNEKLLQFCDILDVRSTPVSRYNTFLIKASIQFLSAMGWLENVTIFIPDEHVAAEFFSFSKKEMICVKDCVLYGSRCPAILNNSSPFVFFGYKRHFELLKKWQNLSSIDTEDINGLFVPLDGSLPTDLPANTFLIVPPHQLPAKIFTVPENILPSAAFFEIVNPILTYVKNIENFISTYCNGSVNVLTCIRERYKKMYRPVLITPASILSTLKIEGLQQDFIYNIYQIDNETLNTTELVKKNNLFQPLTKVFEYSIFGNNLTSMDPQFEPIYSINSSDIELNKECISIFTRTNIKYVLDESEIFAFRSESWVFAFLSLSLLGAIFCIAILIFILVSIFRRDILEGNPLLTLALLLAVMLLFCSVLPFSLEYNKYTRYPLCLLKSLSVTLGYALVFSLLLSRCILLATASKELGFMSHIAGAVQSFLCLFIFGVQAALSLQLLSKCYEIFRNHSFVYLMSYNTMLLLLLLCLCPLIFKCQRNYREGKYFTIAIILTNCVWFIWVPLYAILEEEWQEPLLCFGLVSTASIFLGAIFIPRTYLMTIAAARNKITSTLPSLTTATSAIDIYRGHQPIYDCVNVAAINAVAVARAGVTAPTPALQQPDLYSCPALPEDEELDFRCDTPTDDDKVTRF